MSESSSAVRSLLDFGFYLYYKAKPGDLLMLDEPELNLHPDSQRKLARLLVQLIDIGIKVFITTHSDFLVKELSILIMLNQDKEHIKEIIKEEGYKSNELLNHQDIKVYIAEKSLIKPEGYNKKTSVPTVVAAKITPEDGIETRSFDETIVAMNGLQDKILFGY